MMSVRSLRRRTSGLVRLVLAGQLVAWGATFEAMPANAWAQAAQDASAAKPAGSFEIPAWAFDRGNGRTFTTTYADAGPMVAFGGESPVVIEYDIPFPVTAEYTLSICFTAAQARPVELYLDKKHLGQCCREATGSWNTSGAKWELTRKIAITEGKHTVKLQRDGAFPHVVALKFDSPVPFPEGWTMKRPNARKLDTPVTLLSAFAVAEVEP